MSMHKSHTPAYAGKGMKSAYMARKTKANGGKHHSESAQSSPSAAGTGASSGSEDSFLGDAEADDAGGHVDEDEADDDEDEPEIDAPSGTSRARPGLRPTLSFTLVESEPAAAADSRTGLSGDTHLFTPKKRTFSNLSTNSVLHDDDTPQLFPRKKHATESAVGSAVLGEIVFASEDGDFDANESAIADTDDDDYGDVDLVSDEEELAGPDLEKVEEKLLMDEFGTGNGFSFFEPQSAIEDPLELDGAPEATPFFDTAIDLEPERRHRKQSQGSERRVHFEDDIGMSSSSSSRSSSPESSFFPDLFVQQDRLDPAIRKAIENDDDEDDGSNDTNEWEYDYGYQSFVPEGFGAAILQLSGTGEPDFSNSDDSDAGSSGYETDMGDTTEEDEPPSTASKTRPTVLRTSSVDSSSDSEIDESPAPFKRSLPTTPAKRASRQVGRMEPPKSTWVLNPNEHNAIVTPSGKLMIYPSRNPRRTTMLMPSISSRTSSTSNQSAQVPQLTPVAEESDISETTGQSVLPQKDLMFTGLSPSAIFGAGLVGPPEAFYPGLMNFDMGDMDMEYDEDDDFDEDITLEEFLEFSEEDEDEDNADHSRIVDEEATEGTETPASPSNTSFDQSVVKGSRAQSYLEHHDRYAPTAFRSNLDRHRRLSRLPQNDSLRARITRPVRSGRSANDPLTPLRKKRNPDMFYSSPLSQYTRKMARQ